MRHVVNLIKSLSCPVALTLLATAWAPSAKAAPGGGDFPFFVCSSHSLDLNQFTINPDGSSPTGYMLHFTNSFGFGEDMPVSAARSEPYWYAQGTMIEPLGKQRSFQAQIPTNCGGNCNSVAQMSVSRFGISLPVGPLVSPARCQQNRR